MTAHFINGLIFFYLIPIFHTLNWCATIPSLVSSWPNFCAPFIYLLIDLWIYLSNVVQNNSSVHINRWTLGVSNRSYAGTHSNLWKYSFWLQKTWRFLHKISFTSSQNMHWNSYGIKLLSGIIVYVNVSYPWGFF